MHSLFLRSIFCCCPKAHLTQGNCSVLSGRLNVSHYRGEYRGLLFVESWSPQVSEAWISSKKSIKRSVVCRDQLGIKVNPCQFIPGWNVLRYYVFDEYNLPCVCVLLPQLVLHTAMRFYIKWKQGIIIHSLSHHGGIFYKDSAPGINPKGNVWGG